MSHDVRATDRGIRKLARSTSQRCRHERAQLAAKLNEDAKIIDDLKRQLSEQSKIVNI